MTSTIILTKSCTFYEKFDLHFVRIGAKEYILVEDMNKELDKFDEILKRKEEK